MLIHWFTLSKNQLVGKTIVNVSRTADFQRLLFEFDDGEGLFLERQAEGAVPPMFGAVLKSAEMQSFKTLFAAESAERSGDEVGMKIG